MYVFVSVYVIWCFQKKLKNEYPFTYKKGIILYVRITSGKTGFHSSHFSRTKFDPRLKGPSVPVHLKMWSRGH
jgi:hypothetical protein